MIDMKRVILRLTAPEIFSLSSTPRLLTPAPKPNEIAALALAFIRYMPNTIPFTDTEFRLLIGGTRIGRVTGIGSGLDDQIGVILSTVWEGPYNDTDLLGLPITLTSRDQVTEGDGTLTVTLLYQTVPIA